jgi:hypothetical protein
VAFVTSRRARAALMAAFTRAEYLPYVTWSDAASLATAAGTLVLAVATFSSVKSANRSARVAERALLVGQRPVLIPSREGDPVERVRFGDGHVVTVPGHGGCIDLAASNVYLAIALRNGGNGLAVIHGWRVEVANAAGTFAPDVADFRPQQRDLFIPAGESGFWQGAVRDSSDRDHDFLANAAESGERVFVDLLYGDHEGGQRTIVRFGVWPRQGTDYFGAEAVRYWNVDSGDPRERPQQAPAMQIQRFLGGEARAHERGGEQHET